MSPPARRTRTCRLQNRPSQIPQSSIIQIVELFSAPIASETRMKLPQEIESGSPCSLALQARLRIDRLEPCQRLLHDVSQLIVGERAVLFERDKRADAQHEGRTPPP